MCVTRERRLKFVAGLTEVHAREALEVARSDILVWREQPSICRDDAYRSDLRRHRRERSRVRDLAAEIQAAEKREHVSERRAGGRAQLPREGKIRLWVQERFRAASVAARRRQDE